MKHWKGCLALLLALLCLGLVSALAAGERVEDIQVNGQSLDRTGLPREPYWEGETLMVPLRKIAEALGYTVTWDRELHAAVVDDGYIQRAVLRPGTVQVDFTGHLKVIDMGRTVENAAKTVIHQGYTYVPLAFFREFFNDTALEGGVVTVAPSMAELCG